MVEESFTMIVLSLLMNRSTIKIWNTKSVMFMKSHMKVRKKLFR
jgi:hypothetical protein